MTGRFFTEGVYALVGDIPESRSDGMPMYAPETIARVATSLREEIIGQMTAALEGIDYPRVPLSERPIRLTLMNLVKQAAGTSGSAVPDDLIHLIAGRTSAGVYIPKSKVHYADAVNTQSIWMRGGIFYGSADIAWYYGSPAEVIEVSDVEFTELDDSFYDMLMWATAEEMVRQEKTEAALKASVFFASYMATLQTLH